MKPLAFNEIKLKLYILRTVEITSANWKLPFQLTNKPAYSEFQLLPKKLNADLE